MFFTSMVAFSFRFKSPTCMLVVSASSPLEVT